MNKVFLVLLLGLAGLMGCASVDVDDAFGNIPRAAPAKDCSGTSNNNGCDDCNPCTWDMYCDPSTQGPFVPSYCAGITSPQCIHEDRTTSVGYIDDCFPVAVSVDVHAGKCCAGQCVDNSETCAGYCGPFVDTTLPASGLGDVHALCTSCDVGKCDALGAPCASYGEPCGAGVCVTCCNGVTGELRCSVPLLAAGAPCVVDSECSSDLCLPWSDTANYCFDRSQEGCNVVFMAFDVPCNAPAKTYVCGDSWDVSTLGKCNAIAVGKLGETYHCCNGALP